MVIHDVDGNKGFAGKHVLKIRAADVFGAAVYVNHRPLVVNIPGKVELGTHWT